MIVTAIVQLLAQTSTGTSGKGAPPAYQLFSSSMFPFVILLVVMWVFMFRSKKGGDKAREAALKELKRGDRVQTIGGIMGTVVEARENEVVLKVDESSNTKIKFTRSAIHRVVDDDKVAAK